MKKILLASNNANKIKEIGKLLSDFDIEVVSLKDLKLGDPVEDGKNFTENSLIKARFGFEKSGLPTLADDSGFCIESMNDFPGLCSARFAEACGDYESAFKVIDKCINPLNKKASFVTSLAFIYKFNDDVIEKNFDGKIEGNFVYPGRGNNGFGYCPVFIPNGYKETFAEMDNEFRTKINHRRIALDKFFNFIKEIKDKI